MVVMELMQKIIEAETEDERMSILKENSDIFEEQEALNVRLEQSGNKIAELKTEIKERFFGKHTPNEDEKESYINEATENANTKRLTDLGFGVFKY